MKILKKNKAVSTIIALMAIGFLGKGLSMIARILMTRVLGIEAMSIFTLVNPAMVLVITLAQLGLPTAIATLISRNPEKSKKIFISGLFLSIAISVILMVTLYFCSPFLAEKILKNTDVTLTLYGLGILVPLVSLSSLIKGFFIGHNEVKFTAFSSVAEEVVRIVFIVFFLNYYIAISPAYGAFGAMIGVAVGEIAQSLYLIFSNNRQLYKRVPEIFILSPNHSFSETPRILSLSLPITLSRLIGSITYFFEPIIMTNVLLKLGMSSSEITLNYGIIAGYVMPLLLLGGFFALALSNYLLPNMTRAIAHRQNKKAKRLFLNTLTISFLIGLGMSIIYYFQADNLMRILYGTTTGANYVRLLAFPFLIYYIETPLMTAMHALNYSKQALLTSIISCTLRLLALILLLPYYHVTAVAIATLISVIANVAVNAFCVTRFFLQNHKKTVNCQKS